jgi:hypothetical protein
MKTFTRFLALAAVCLLPVAMCALLFAPIGCGPAGAPPAASSSDDDDFMDWYVNPANPISPLSPMNPTSPLNPNGIFYTN